MVRRPGTSRREAARGAEERCGRAGLAGRSGRPRSRAGSTSPKSQPPRALSISLSACSKASRRDVPSRLVAPVRPAPCEAAVPDKAGVRSEHAASKAGKRLKRFIRRQFVLRDPWLVESATSVYAAMAGGRIGYYWRRKRQGTSGRSFPGVRSRTRPGRHGRLTASRRVLPRQSRPDVLHESERCARDLSCPS